MDALLIVISFLLMPILTIGIIGILEDRRKHTVKGILEKALNQLTTENGLLIADAEFFRNKVIGIDRKNKKLAYVNYREGDFDQFCIDLNLLAFCGVNKTMDKSSNKVKELFLEVVCKGIDKIFRLNFYERPFDNIRAEELLFRKAEQWKDKINLYRRSVNFNNQYECVL